MNTKAVIFDLDGTLLNTLDDLADSMNQILSRHKLPTHPSSAYRYFVGNGALQLVTRAIPESQRNDSFIQTCFSEFISEYGQNWNHKTRPYEGIEQLLGQLQQRHIALTVLTNKPHDAALKCMAEFFPGWNFSIILGQRMGVPVKPDPTAVEEILRHLNISHTEAIFIGDSNVDMETGTNAQLQPIGVSWGFRSRQELESAGAAAVIDHPMELLDYLDN
ncbi:HAD family hydrolase [Gynuella sunshinyii]|uniref:phosphoglycolate phosphatase n=1 Tax=Gynuella sunshinyii YC6258 TaxID=1445510 RepID=A0A0C5VMI9_9GAMM|nr:HAD family hydrolase [Gynuella sunshinyii]AJQ95947.1 putative phosphatase [Gynuella sunshinyii YC6258]